MIQQLVERMATSPGSGFTQSTAAQAVLGADSLDLVLHMEQVWDASAPWSPNPPPAGPARRALWATGSFNGFAPPAATTAWDHLGYALVLEMSRVVQIFRRVILEYRTGERLGTPSVETQRWLDATEALLFGAAYPVAAWLSTSGVRPDAEAVRRNAYYRLFGMDLAFGADDNRPVSYIKAETANKSFVPVFEELLHELWQAISNLRNMAGVNQADDDRIL